jgi:tetratricopeptide (TPR) repeat protein
LLLPQNLLWYNFYIDYQSKFYTLKNLLSFFKRDGQYTTVGKVTVLSIIIIVGIFVVNYQIKHAKVPYEELTILLNNNQYEQVIKEGEYYLSNNEQDEKLYVILAKAYVGYGASVSELDSYAKKALVLLDRLNNKSIMYFSTRGYIYYVTENYDGCISSYKEVLVFVPESSSFITKLAQCYEANNMLKTASTNYSRAIELDKNNMDAVIGSLRMQSKYYRSYDSVLNKAYSLLDEVTDPNYLAPLQEIVAVEFARKGENEKAEKYYTKSLEVRPSSVVSLIGLADIHLRYALSKLSVPINTVYSVTQKSEELAKTALKHKPGYVYAYLILHDIEQLRGNKDMQTKYKGIIEDILKNNTLSSIEKKLVQDRLNVYSLSSIKSKTISATPSIKPSAIIKK